MKQHYENHPENYKRTPVIDNRHNQDNEVFLVWTATNISPANWRQLTAGPLAGRVRTRRFYGRSTELETYQ